MPDGPASPEQSSSQSSSIDSIRRLGQIGPDKPYPKSSTPYGSAEGKWQEQIAAGNISKPIEIGKNVVDMVGKTTSPEDALREQIERTLAYERAVEGSLERIASTTLPWEVRMAIRDEEFQFVDAPLGLGDNWGYQTLYNGIEKRKSGLERSFGGDSSSKVLGLDIEPWRATSVIPRQNITELQSYLLGKGLKTDEVDAKIFKLEKDAKERIPVLCKELGRSKDEVALIRKIFILGWTMKSAASGNEVGDTYLQAKLPAYPRPKDFATIFKLPSYYMSESEAGTLAGYPQKTDVQQFLEQQGRSKENLLLGETTEKESRLLRLVALSERPELVMKWKQKTEMEALFEIFKEKGVNEAYLVLKEKGIDYRDPSEEAKINTILVQLDNVQKQNIKDVWWKNLGFNGEVDGISKMGDPEMWIPMKARRGEPPAKSSKYFVDIDRGDRITQIRTELETLKKHWQNLSALNNLNEKDKEIEYGEIEKSTDRLRALQTIDDGEKLITIFPTLQLEREMMLRKGAAEMGCIWSIPKTAGEKEKMMEKVFTESIGGDHLAYETAKLVNDMFGFQAKYGIYAVDYDPRNKNKSNGGWGQVGAEAWPYTNEFQNILAFPWYAKYKLEAGGPEGSRGRFGPLMTDYLTSCVMEEQDEYGNKLYIIIDSNKQIRKGRSDEGLVIADTARNMMDIWEKGKSLSDPELWNDVLEDPFRRYLLRGFFAEGKAAIGGAGMMDIWKKREWKLEELDNDKFWDDYKLSRKVTVRDELYDEDVWVDVLREHNRNYRFKAGQVVTEVKSATNPNAIITKESGMYSEWKDGRKKTIFNYSDQMFWNGVASTEGALAWFKNEPGLFLSDSPKSEPASVVIDRIIRRANKCTVNLVGTYSSPQVTGILRGNIKVI